MRIKLGEDPRSLHLSQAAWLLVCEPPRPGQPFSGLLNFQGQTWSSTLAPGLALELHRPQSLGVLQALWGLSTTREAWTWQASPGSLPNTIPHPQTAGWVGQGPTMPFAGPVLPPV